jgi:hypothetical protein
MLPTFERAAAGHFSRLLRAANNRKLIQRAGRIQSAGRAVPTGNEAKTEDTNLLSA